MGQKFELGWENLKYSLKLTKMEHQFYKKQLIYWSFKDLNTVSKILDLISEVTTKMATDMLETKGCTKVFTRTKILKPFLTS